MFEPGFYWTRKTTYFGEDSGWHIVEIDDHGQEWHPGVNYGLEPGDPKDYVGPLKPPEEK